MNDEDLLNSFLSGRKAALEDLARRHERLMLGLARGLLGGDAALARDAVQETWVRVIGHGRRFRGHSSVRTCSVRTWMYRILVNHCRDLRRRASADARRARARGPDAPSAAPPPEDHEELRSAVERLPLKQREVVLLCYHDGITCESAAQILRVPVGTVKSRLHAALVGLRAELARRPDST